MRRLLIAALAALLCAPTLACNENEGPLVTRLIGESPAGLWHVSWDMAEDTGGFTDTVGATTVRTFCVVLSEPRSLGTIGAAVQKIRIAPDRTAAMAIAWAQYVTLPLDHPRLAGVAADFRARACPQLLPYRPAPCL